MIGTIEAFQDHGVVRGQTATEGMDRAHALWSDLAALGIPSEEAYLATYCRRVGRTSIADWEFYVAFSMFRLRSTGALDMSFGAGGLAA